jgi:hypothetical protein
MGGMGVKLGLQEQEKRCLKRRVFGPKKEEIKKRLEKWHYDELHNF